MQHRTIDEAREWLVAFGRLERINEIRKQNVSGPETLEHAAQWLVYWSKEDLDGLDARLNAAKDPANA